MTATSNCGSVFTALRWPTDIDFGSEGERFGGTAVWRQDRQTYAVLVDGGDRWVGDRHGQFPTIAALCWGLDSEGLELSDNSVDSLYGLAAIAETALGPGWLVGIETDREAALGIVHPDESVTRLHAADIVGDRSNPLENDMFFTRVDNSGDLSPQTRFGWSRDDPEALLVTAIAAYGASVGDIGGDWKREATALVSRGFVGLPSEFAVPLNSLHQSETRIQAASDIPAIKVLETAISQQDFQQTRACHQHQGIGR